VSYVEGPSENMQDIARLKSDLRQREIDIHELNLRLGSALSRARGLAAQNKELKSEVALFLREGQPRLQARILELEAQLREINEFVGRESEVKRDAQARILDLEERMRVRDIMSFKRRVDEEWIDPSRSKHYTAGASGNVYVYDYHGGDPVGLYPALVVPKELVGKVVVIREDKT